MKDLDFCKEILDYVNDGVYGIDPQGRITYWNKAAERLSGYQREEVVNQHCLDDILMRLDGQGQGPGGTLCPATKSFGESGSSIDGVYLRHKEGFLLPVAVRVAPIKDPRGKVISGLEVFSDASAEITAFQKMSELEGAASLDPLTQVARTKDTEIFIQARLDEMERYKWPFGILFLDIDHLQNINYSLGHEVGDRILQMVAKTLVKNARPFDFVGRCGGQEFVAILCNTSKNDIFVLAEKYRNLITNSKLTVDGEAVSVTVSIGATIACRDDSVEIIMQRAKKGMEESKARKRNCVTLEC